MTMRGSPVCCGCPGLGGLLEPTSRGPTATWGGSPSVWARSKGAADPATDQLEFVVAGQGLSDGLCKWLAWSLV